MARIVLVHGAFHELSGPHALLARWLPALRDGLWHQGVEIDDSEVGVCFYGDLFRFDPSADDPVRLAAARPNLVTLGSPLATESVFPTLGTIGPDGFGVWPAALERWVNVVAHDDPVVGGTRLAERFGPRVEDSVVDNGHRPHDPEPYLNAAITGASIAAALTD